MLFTYNWAYAMWLATVASWWSTVSNGKAVNHETLNVICFYLQQTHIQLLLTKHDQEVFISLFFF